MIPLCVMGKTFEIQLIAFLLPLYSTLLSVPPNTTANNMQTKYCSTVRFPYTKDTYNNPLNLWLFTCVFPCFFLQNTEKTV